MTKKYCKDCAFLLLFEAGGVHPVCLATARFEKGPLRPDMDVSGVISAIDRNRDNDCEYHSRFANRESRRIKNWIIKRLSHDGRAKRLEDFPRESELASIRELRRREPEEAPEEATDEEVAFFVGELEDGEDEEDNES